MNETHHILYHHLLQRQNDLPIIRTSLVSIWPSIFLLICLVILVVLRVTSYQKVIKIMQAIFNFKTAKSIDGEEYKFFKLSSILLNVFFIFNMAFLCYKLNSIYRLILVKWSGVMQLLFFILFMLLFKFLLNRLLLFISNNHKVVSEYNLIGSLINQTFALFIFPFVVLLQFSKYNSIFFLFCALVILASAEIYKWYRGFLISLIEQRIGLLQIFTYFCALEILPGLILLKYIIETF
jgi:Domain of unknown function (DUF4271)